MQLSKIGFVFAISAIVLALTGCGDDKPSDKIASETIRKYAESEAAYGLEVANFKRANGQVDPSSANLYKVTYSYDLRLTKPLAEIVLANAKALQSDRVASGKQETGSSIDMAKLQNTLGDMQTGMIVNQWIQSQRDTFKARRDAFVGGCSPCLAYYNSEEAPEEAEMRRKAFISSWIYVENLGFKDDAKTGDGVPRNAWAFFSKTEKGWQPAN